MKNALLAVPLLVVGVAVTAGCGPSSGASASAPSGAASPAAAGSSSAASSPSAAATQASAAPSASASGSSGGSSSTAGSSGSTAACTSSDLTGSIGNEGAAGDGMNQHRGGLQLKNTSSKPCTLYGYPGVSWVAGANGQQVGAGATREGNPSGSEKTVTLAPGALASAPLDIANTDVFPESDCKPVSARGLRVYPPGEKSALFVKDPGTACSGTTSSPSIMIGYLQSGAQPGTVSSS